MIIFFFFFFFQAADGIRDFHVTGVQTCALSDLFRRLAKKHEIIVVSEGAPRSPPVEEIDRKSVVEGKSVDLGGCRIIKKKKKKNNRKLTRIKKIIKIVTNMYYKTTIR